MYQFYYAEKTAAAKQETCTLDVEKQMEITAVRPAMWEEHCLECAAPTCFGQCPHYEARKDGRCKRFANGILVSQNPKGVCKEAARVKFRKWANMMTVIYPTMLPVVDYARLTRKNARLGRLLGKINRSKLPQSVRWQGIRIPEFLRRRKLRHMTGGENRPDAFLLHCYSFEPEPFRLILEVFCDNAPVFKMAMELNPGENLQIVPASALSDECSKAGNLVKLYPENDREAEIEFYWCDFVKGHMRAGEYPAEKVKCLVWDLDGTLWDGTLIETENTDTLRLRPGVREIIEELDRRGILLSIASKNDYDAAWAVIEKLGLSDFFLYPQIHWSGKSGSIETIAKALNIGVDALALVDDTAFERQQVRSVWPQVRTYDVTELDSLLRLPEFSAPVTRESKARRGMYQAEAQRREMQQSRKVDTTEFLRQCHLKLKLFAPEGQQERLRCYELAARTNQLNMSGRKYTPEEFEAVLTRPGYQNVAFSCRDDFGDYGIVGFAQYRVEKETLEFTEFAMSCRVAGKYVESALFAALLEKEHCTAGNFAVQITKKNALLRKTLEDIGFQITNQNGERVDYQFSKGLKNQDIVQIAH